MKVQPPPQSQKKIDRKLLCARCSNDSNKKTHKFRFWWSFGLSGKHTQNDYKIEGKCIKLLLITNSCPSPSPVFNKDWKYGQYYSLKRYNWFYLQKAWQINGEFLELSVGNCCSILFRYKIRKDLFFIFEKWYEILITNYFIHNIL